MIDWSSCAAVERDADRVSGAWLFRGTRVPVSALFENLEDGVSAIQFVDLFPGVTLDQVRAVLEHAARSALAPAWVRVLFDQGTPVPLRDVLPAHDVTTAYERGWSRLENGELLDAAEREGFEVVVTTDTVLLYQQNLSGRRVAIVCLLSTSWPRIQRVGSAIADAIAPFGPGGYIEVHIPWRRLTAGSSGPAPADFARLCGPLSRNVGPTQFAPESHRADNRSFAPRSFPVKTYSAVIERDPDTGLFVGFVPGFPGAHSQGATLDELNANLREVISMLLEDGDPILESEFVGVQNVAIAWIVGNVPVLKPADVVAILRRLGFAEVRQRGSHKQFRNSAGRTTTVPFHSGRDIAPVLLRQIAKDIGLTVSEMLEQR